MIAIVAQTIYKTTQSSPQPPPQAQAYCEWHGQCDGQRDRLDTAALLCHTRSGQRQYASRQALLRIDHRQHRCIGQCDVPNITLTGFSGSVSAGELITATATTPSTNGKNSEFSLGAVANPNSGNSTPTSIQLTSVVEVWSHNQ